MAARPEDDADGPDAATGRERPAGGQDRGADPGGFRFVSAYTPATSDSTPDGRVFAPAASRNADAVAEALAQLLGGAEGTLVEIGSGTGQHAAAASPRLPGIRWQPSDPEPAQFPSIEAWAAHAGTGRILTPIALDAAEPWDRMPEIAALAPLAAVFAANVIHIAPWAVAEGMIAGAGRALTPGGRLVLYGPFREGGAHTGEGNARFDAALRSRDPSHGLRDLEAVSALAEAAGMGPPAILRMPANNLVLAFTKA